VRCLIRRFMRQSQAKLHLTAQMVRSLRNSNVDIGSATSFCALHWCGLRHGNDTASRRDFNTRLLARREHMIRTRLALGNGTGVCDMFDARLAGKAP